MGQSTLYRWYGWGSFTQYIPNKSTVGDNYFRVFFCKRRVASYVAGRELSQSQKVKHHWIDEMVKWMEIDKSFIKQTNYYIIQQRTMKTPSNDKEWQITNSSIVQFILLLSVVFNLRIIQFHQSSLLRFCWSSRNFPDTSQPLSPTALLGWRAFHLHNSTSSVSYTVQHNRNFFFFCAIDKLCKSRDNQAPRFNSQSLLLDRGDVAPTPSKSQLKMNLGTRRGFMSTEEPSFIRSPE